MLMIIDSVQPYTFCVHFIFHNAIYQTDSLDIAKSLDNPHTVFEHCVYHHPMYWTDCRDHTSLSEQKRFFPVF